MDLSRQELYIGKEASRKLQKKRAAIVGIGALGTVAASLLARSGVKLILIDRDVVEPNNLQRQLLFHNKDIGKHKASTAAFRLKEIFPGISVKAYDLDLNKDTAELLDADAVLDCTDNLFTRFVINDYCRKNRIPWVHGSAIEENGYVLPVLPGKACFRCIFESLKSSRTCDTAGVMNTVTAVIGSVQASEALKILLGNRPEQGLVHATMRPFAVKTFSVRKRKDCKTCKGVYEYLEKELPVAHFCGSNKYQFAGSYSKDKIMILRNKFPDWIFSGNSVIIRAGSRDEALRMHAKYLGH